MTRGQEISKAKTERLYKDWLESSTINYLVERIINDMEQMKTIDRKYECNVGLQLINLLGRSRKLLSSAKA